MILYNIVINFLRRNPRHRDVPKNRILVGKRRKIGRFLLNNYFTYWFRVTDYCSRSRAELPSKKASARESRRHGLRFRRSISEFRSSFSCVSAVRGSNGTANVFKNSEFWSVQVAGNSVAVLCAEQACSAAVVFFQ